MSYGDRRHGIVRQRRRIGDRDGLPAKGAGGAMLSRLLRKDSLIRHLSEDLREGQVEHHEKVRRKRNPDIENSQCKGPEVYS